jgi:hypothetical protein
LSERAALEQQIISGVQLVAHNEEVTNSYEMMTDAVKAYYKATTKEAKLFQASKIGQVFGINVTRDNES